MRKRIISLIGGAVLAAGILAPAAALAMAGQTGNNVGLAKGEVHNGTFYAAGSTIDIKGTINGDLVCAGQTVKVSGIIHGDVLCAAQDITVAGRIDGSVRVAGQTVNVNGAVGRNVNIAAQELATGTGSSVGGEVAFLGQNVSINGPVMQDLYGSASKVVMDATIGGDVDLQTETVDLGPGAKLAGDLSYTATKESFIDNEKIAGKVKYTAPVVEKKTFQQIAMEEINSYFFWTVAVLLIALSMVGLAPKFVIGAISAMRKNAGTCFGWGALLMFVLPIAALFVMATGLGAPLAGLALLVWVLVMSLAGSIVAIAAGRMVLGRFKWHADSLLFAALVGVPLAMLVWALPYVGGVVAFVTALWGMGGLAVAAKPGR